VALLGLLDAVLVATPDPGRGDEEDMMTSRLDKALVAIGASVMLSGLTSACAPVAPYQRGALAHPTMTAEDLAYGMQTHVQAISEGGTGGLGGGGGGCGCN
jgi:hypothetical protein